MKINPLRPVILSIFIVFTHFSFGQSLGKFEMIKADTLFTIDSTDWKYYPQNLVFGGISALERLDNGRLFLVSDRQAPGHLPENQYSWAFILNPETNQVEFTFRFFGVKNVESVRFHDNTIWYSYEDDDYTGIGLIDSVGNPVTLTQHSMTQSPFTMHNRGVEGLSVSQDLWYAFEAGADSTVFIKWTDLAKEKEEIYVYPLDLKSCIQPDQKNDGNLGNGVSEILQIPGQRNQLLVMERCFDGKYAYIKLFEASVTGHTFSKKEVFSWNPETKLNGKPIKPDNMEGMIWGDNQNGKKMLYLIADDNQNPKRQRTILVRLLEY